MYAKLRKFYEKQKKLVYEYLELKFLFPKVTYMEFALNVNLVRILSNNARWKVTKQTFEKLNQLQKMKFE